MFLLLAFYEGSLVKLKGCDIPSIFIKEEEYQIIPLGIHSFLCQGVEKKVKKRVTQIGRVFVSQQFLNLNKETLERIEKEKILLGSVYKDPGKVFFKKTVDPLNTMTVVSPFGKEREYGENKKNFLPFFKSMHTGVDLRASEQTRVHSIGKGKVVFTGDLFYTGNTVIISHGYEIFSVYAHLKTIQVKQQQEVYAKSFLGFAGKTGRVSGPHLHLAIKVKGFWIDPLEFLKTFK